MFEPKHFNLKFKVYIFNPDLYLLVTLCNHPNIVTVLTIQGNEFVHILNIWTLANIDLIQ
jgi:hypothetical protein